MSLEHTTAASLEEDLFRTLGLEKPAALPKTIVHVRWLMRAEYEAAARMECDMWEASEGMPEEELPWDREKIATVMKRGNANGVVSEVGESITGFMVYEFRQGFIDLLGLSVKKESPQSVSALAQKLISKLDPVKSRNFVRNSIRKHSKHLRRNVEGCGETELQTTIALLHELSWAHAASEFERVQHLLSAQCLQPHATSPFLRSAHEWAEPLTRVLYEDGGRRFVTQKASIIVGTLREIDRSFSERALTIDLPTDNVKLLPLERFGVTPTLLRKFFPRFQEPYPGSEWFAVKTEDPDLGCPTMASLVEAEIPVVSRLPNGMPPLFINNILIRDHTAPSLQPVLVQSTAVGLLERIKNASFYTSVI